MRPQGWTKLGYYPTPPSVSDIIAQAILPRCHHQPAEAADRPAPVLMLDPCAGEGIALAHLADQIGSGLSRQCGRLHPVVTHGVEPEAARARAARQRLGRVHHASIEHAILPDQAYHLLFLNPPYDWDQEHREQGIRRLESYFLQLCTPALQPGGLLVYLIPQHAFRHDSQMLAMNYEDIRLYRFPDPEYAEFGQSLLIARRKLTLDNPFAVSAPQIDAIERHSRDGTAALGWSRRPDPDSAIGLELYPPVETDGADPEPEIVIRTADDGSLAAALRRNSAWNDPGLRQETEPQPDRHAIRPLEPLRRGHICILAANGQLNNIPLHDPTGKQDPVVIKGSAVRTTERVDSPTDTVRERENFQSRLSYLNLCTGRIREINNSETDISDFFRQWQDSIAAACASRFPPRLSPAAPEYRPIRQRIAAALRRPLIGKQAPSAVTAAVSLLQDRQLLVAAQQGSGKTILAIAAAAGAGFSRLLVVTPPHNIATWVDEIRATTPQARIRVINGIGNPRYPDRATFRREYAVCDLETLRQTPASPERPVWALLKRDSAKMTYPYHTPARVINAADTDGFRPRLYRLKGELKRLPDDDHSSAATCPHCWVAYAGYPNADLRSRNSRCPHCRAFLAGPDIRKPSDRRYPWADYISKRMPRWADLFVADEVHQFKGKRSAQGDVYRRLAQASRRTLALTGTVIGGKAQEAFYLLTAFSPGFHRQFGYHQLTEFNNRYGRVETTYAREGGYYPETRDGARSSVRKGRKLGVKVLNGFHPALLDHFWPHTIFTRIHDIRRDLQHPEIHARLIPMAERQDEAYQQLDAALRTHLNGYLKAGDLRPAAQMLQTLLTYPENCWQGECPTDPETEEPIIVMPPLDADILYPKEETLIGLLREQKRRGRKTLVYCTHTRRRSVTERLCRLLNEAGLQTAVMKSGADQRLRWLRQAAQRYDAVICQPRAVETGLNLLEYPTICWYEIDYSMYTVEQASARSHRINQERQVEIHYLAYQDTMQEQALRLIAAKADTARMIYGELSATGLSAFNPDDADLRTVIARQMYRQAQEAESREIDRNTRLTLEQLRQDGELNRQFAESRQRQEAAARAGAQTLTDLDLSILEQELGQPPPAAVNGHSPKAHPPAAAVRYDNRQAKQLTLTDLLAA